LELEQSHYEQAGVLMTKLNLGAIVINHKSTETVIKAIDSLFQQEINLSEIIVVDDYSQDEGPSQIRKLFPEIQVIETSENVGLSRARNIGLKNISTDFVLFIDDDIYLAKDALYKMVLAMGENPATIVCPRIILHPKDDTIQCDGALIHFAGTLALRHSFQSLWQYPPVRSDVMAFTGACLLFNRKALSALGGFDEDYVFYFEDLELSYRLRALGYRIICEEAAVAMHEHGEGTAHLSFRGAGTYPARRAYLNLRNRWRTIWIHYQIRTLMLLAPALFIYEIAAFLECIRRGWVLLWFKALFSLLGKLKEIRTRRSRWKALRKVSDSAILNGGPLPFAVGFVSGRIEKLLVQWLNNSLNAYWILAKRWL